MYELSSPFLNIHWFCDKLNLTGSKLQWYNGMILLGTFFGCRLVWGTYQSAMVYHDVWKILHMDTTNLFREGHDLHGKTGASIFDSRNGQLCVGNAACVAAQSEVFKFTTADSYVPWWIIAIYLVSNVTLNALNWYWFGKMIETVRKRFDKKPQEDSKQEPEVSKGRRKSIVEHAADTLDREVASGPKTPAVEKTQEFAMSTGADGGGDLKQRRKDG